MTNIDGESLVELDVQTQRTGRKHVDGTAKKQESPGPHFSWGWERHDRDCAQPPKGLGTRPTNGWGSKGDGTESL